MYLKRNNPKNKLLRAALQTEAISFLQKRGAHSQRQLEAAKEMQELKEKMLTGVIAGPGVALGNGGRANVWCVVTKPGTVTVQVSRSGDWSAGPDEVRTGHAGEKEVRSAKREAYARFAYARFACAPFAYARFACARFAYALFAYARFAYARTLLTLCVTQGEPCAALVEIEGLESNCKYFYRACLESEDQSYTGALGGHFVSGNFTTILDSDDSGTASFAFGNFGNSTPSECSTVLDKITSAAARKSSAKNPAVQGLVVIGSLMNPVEARAIGELGGDKEKLTASRKALQGVWLKSNSLSALATAVPMMLAFNDVTKGCDKALYAEESGLEAASSKSKSKRKKSTVSSGTSPALRATSEFFPVQLVRKPTRHLYSKLEMGLNAEMFLLDSRDGYLGTNQGKWLSGALEASTCCWKIIVCQPSVHYTRSIDRNVEVGADSQQELQQQIAKERTSGKEEEKKKGKALSTVDLVLADIMEKGVEGVVFVTGETKLGGVTKQDGVIELSVPSMKVEQHPDFRLKKDAEETKDDLSVDSRDTEETKTDMEVGMANLDCGGFGQLQVLEDKTLVYKLCGGEGEVLSTLKIKAPGAEKKEGEEEKKEGGEVH